MTHNPNLTEAATWYEHFLLQDLRREQGIREPVKRQPLDVRAYFQTAHLYRHISYETGITAAALVAELRFLNVDFDKAIKKCERLIAQGNESQAQEARARKLELLWEKADAERVRMLILSERFPELGGYDENGENWRWYKPVPEKQQLAPEFLHRHGRKIMLASPKLDIDEHQALANQIKSAWEYLLICRTNYKSSDRAYHIITTVFEGFNELRQHMADEVCDLLDVPEGSPTLYGGVQPDPIARRKKSDPTPSGNLDRQTKHEIMRLLSPLWIALREYRKRYAPSKGDLQVRGIDAACEMIGNLARFLEEK